MDKKPAVSVIVPMYKVQKYIKRCLTSLQKQTFTDFEVLMINDGSPDKSAEIAEEFAKTDNRFILFNKENGGISDTRNYGIQRSKGKYLTFIDGDDFVHKDFLNVLYHECEDNHADMSYCRFKYSYFNIINIPRTSSVPHETMETEKALHLVLRDMMLQSYPWNKLYKTSLFFDNNITYPEMYFEDLATSGRLLFHANKLAVSDRYIYYYVKHFGSIMSTMNSKKINDLLLAILVLRNHIQYNGAYEKYKESILFLAKKMYLINMYSIVRQHLINLDFRKIKYNFNTNRKLYEYIISDNYQATDNIPALPFEIIQPGYKRKKKSQ